MKVKKGYSRDFMLVLIGQIISLFGNATMRFALPIHLLNETGSAAILGIVSGCAFIPLAVMAPIGGMIADRVNKRNIMVFLDFFTSGLTVVFLLLYGKVSITGLVLVTMFLLYGISGAYQPSVQASIPVLVSEEKIMPSAAMINMVSSLSGLLGPALGGMAYSVWGIYPVLVMAAGCFFLSAVMEIFIHMPHQKRPMEKSVLQEAKADFTQSITYICREKSEVGKLTLCCAGVNMVLSSLMIIGLPVIVMQVLDFSSAAEATKLYGFMQAIMAVGGLIGGMGAGVFSKKLQISDSWKLLVWSGVLLVPIGIVLMVPCSPYLAYTILALTALMIMALAAVYTIQIMSYIQLTVPQDMVGKVIAWIIAVSTCAQPIGQMMYGFLFEKVSGTLELIFYISAVLSVLIAWGSKKASGRLNLGEDYDEQLSSADEQSLQNV